MREGKKVGKVEEGTQSSGAPQVPVSKGDFEKSEGVRAHLLTRILLLVFQLVLSLFRYKPTLGLLKLFF